jgi:hypothetical protein
MNEVTSVALLSIASCVGLASALVLAPKTVHTLSEFFARLRRRMKMLPPDCLLIQNGEGEYTWVYSHEICTKSTPFTLSLGAVVERVIRGTFSTAREARRACWNYHEMVEKNKRKNQWYPVEGQR